MFFFKVFGVFLGRINEMIKCEIFYYCKFLCFNMLKCELSKECKIEWKIGIGMGNFVWISKNIVIDGWG